MSELTLELYNALVQIGFDKQLAGKVSKLVIDRDEAKGFATKLDMLDLKADQKVITAKLNMLTAINTAIFVSIMIEFLWR